MIGFSSDVFSPKKFMSIEERIPMKASISDTELLDLAIKVYENNIELFKQTDL